MAESKQQKINSFIRSQCFTDPFIAFTFLTDSNWDLSKAMKAYNERQQSFQMFMATEYSSKAACMKDTNNQHERVIIPNVTRSLHIGFQHYDNSSPFKKLNKSYSEVREF